MPPRIGSPLSTYVYVLSAFIIDGADFTFVFGVFEKLLR
jgi:hypothetical protein